MHDYHQTTRIEEMTNRLGDALAWATSVRETLARVLHDDTSTRYVRYCMLHSKTDALWTMYTLHRCLIDCLEYIASIYNAISNRESNDVHVR